MDGRTTLTAGSLLDNLHWHYVTIKRYGRQVNMTVDSQTVTAICNGEFTQLDLDTQVTYGTHIKRLIMNIFTKCFIRENFHVHFIYYLLVLSFSTSHLMKYFQCSSLTFCVYLQCEYILWLVTVTECLSIFLVAICRRCHREKYASLAHHTKFSRLPGERLLQ